MLNTVIVNTSEICLKGGNRRMFEHRLMDNMRAALSESGDFRIERHQASFHLVWPEQLSDSVQDLIKERLSKVFGVARFSLAHQCKLDIEDITAKTLEIISDDMGPAFKIEARRSDKTFPLTSPEIGVHVGAAVLKAKPYLKVDLSHPDTRIRIQIVSDKAFVAIDPAHGPGGLPVGSSGKLVSLLSGGIDSPVATWKMISRGCRLVFVHFHSYPYVSRESVDKIKRLAKVLDGWQGGSRLYLLPFGDIQKEIVAKGKEANRVVLYRRMMFRLAEAVAKKEGALGLVTGDSVGQVASQTIENIQAVSVAVSLPVYRPLCGDDKESITALAERIGTYRLSIEPHDDCCSLFTPDHPVTKATIADLDIDESRYDIKGFVAKALESAEVIDFSGKNKVGTAEQS